MSWNYSGDPSASDKDAVRFEIGDTDSEDQLMNDEELLFVLGEEGTVLGGAARCCEILSRKFARQADYTLGPQSVRASQRSKAFQQLGETLRSRLIALHSGNGIYVGGVDKGEDLTDKDLRQPAFKRRLMDNRG